MSKDTVMNISEFRLLVDGIQAKINKGSTTSIEESIQLVKVYNSIMSYDLSDEEPYKTFQEEFTDKYLDHISKQLCYKVSIGMGYYCDKFNLSIGGIQFPKDSYIVIAELQKK